MKIKMSCCTYCAVLSFILFIFIGTRCTNRTKVRSTNYRTILLIIFNYLYYLDNVPFFQMVYKFIYIYLLYRDFDRFPLTSYVQRQNRSSHHFNGFLLEEPDVEDFCHNSGIGGRGRGGGECGRKREWKEGYWARYSGFGANARYTTNGTLVRYPRFPGAFYCIYGSHKSTFRREMPRFFSAASTLCAPPYLLFQLLFILEWDTINRTISIWWQRPRYSLIIAFS